MQARRQAPNKVTPDTPNAPDSKNSKHGSQYCTYRSGATYSFLSVVQMRQSI